jgi:LysR family transcriptional regulator, hca operon transcriptional activator
MELRHLRYFVSVAEALSFTKAAEKLHTAQPSLTRQIKDLEEELGVRLLNRTKQSVTLTDEAAHFWPTPNAFLLSQPKLSSRSDDCKLSTLDVMSHRAIYNKTSYTE